MSYRRLWLALMLCVITTPVIAQDAANPNDVAVAPDEGAVRGELPAGYVRNAYAHMMSVPQPYPTEANLMRQEGSPVVQTVVYGNGRIQYALAESSGSPVLDKAALQMVESARPFPAWGGSADEYIVLNIPIIYQLNANSASRQEPGSDQGDIGMSSGSNAVNE